MTDRLTEKLRPHASDIKAAAYAGDAKAIEIIKLHRMWCDVPHDHAAPALCEAAFDEWINKRSRATDQQGGA